MRDYRVTVTPFLYILREDEDPLAYYLVAQQQSVAAEILADER